MSSWPITWLHSLGCNLSDLLLGTASPHLRGFSVESTRIDLNSIFHRIINDDLPIPAGKTKRDGEKKTGSLCHRKSVSKQKAGNAITSKLTLASILCCARHIQGSRCYNFEYDEKGVERGWGWLCYKKLRGKLMFQRNSKVKENNYFKNSITLKEKHFLTRQSLETRVLTQGEHKKDSRNETQLLGRLFANAIFNFWETAQKKKMASGKQ